MRARRLNVIALPGLQKEKRGQYGKQGEKLQDNVMRNLFLLSRGECRRVGSIVPREEKGEASRE